jgi:hypothetical protein
LFIKKNNKNGSLKVISITNQQLTYPVALILSTTRKTCEAMPSLAGKSGDTFCRLLKKKLLTTHDLVNIAKNILFGSSYYLILDDTIIEKLMLDGLKGLLIIMTHQIVKLCAHYVL